MRFSLRQILGCIALCSVTLSLLMFATKEHRRRFAIRRSLELQGASWVHFSKLRDTPRTHVLFTSIPTETLRESNQVRCVEFKMFDVSPECLRKLQDLRSLDSLMITSCKLNDQDLATLADLPPISNLILWNVNVGDNSLPAIAETRGLEQVVFKNTKVTPAGVERFRDLRPLVKVVIK